MPFPPDYNLNLMEFLPAAREAVSLVTVAAAEGDWDSLEGLVTPECIAGLRKELQGIGQQERNYVAVNTNDIFLSFISNTSTTKNGTNVHLVTFSFPGMEKINKVQGLINEKVAELKSSGELNNANVVAAREKIQSETGINLDEEFRNNEIIIGNYRLERQSVNGQWVISEVGQINSMQAWHPLFRWKWRGRLGISLKMQIPFMSVLRADYTSDWLVLIVFYFAVMQGGMMPPSHG